jgi:hypothetical protein
LGILAWTPAWRVKDSAPPSIPRFFAESMKPSRICRRADAGGTDAAVSLSSVRASRSCKEIPMKGLNQKKSDKKKPAKTMKEKRSEKQAKKAAKGH